MNSAQERTDLATLHTNAFGNNTPNETAGMIQESYSFPSSYEGEHHLRIQLIEFRNAQDFAYNQGPALTQKGQLALKDPITSFWLPIPDQIQTPYGPSWDFTDLETAGLLLHGAPDLYNKLSNELDSSDAFGDKISKLGSMIGDVGSQLGPKYIRAVIRKLVPQNYLDAFDIARGQAANPFRESIFRGVGNRSFTFSWSFYPRNPADCSQILFILSALKYHASPSLNGDLGSMLDYPGEFLLSFMNGKTINKFLPKIGVCVCTGIDINFTSAGQWSALQNGHPVDLQLNLSFGETEIVTKEKVLQGY